ncbi:hypothetical protein HK096_009312, partial [Nowakowskiella sp. JEL0078]
MPNFPALKNDLILRAARGEDVERVPVWIMRQAGRYLPEFRAVRAQHDFFHVCRTPELAAEVTLQPINRYDGLLDASIIFSDILVIPQALGMEVEMLDKKGPHFPNPIVDPSGEEYLKVVSYKTNVARDLGYVYEAITLTRKLLNGRVPLFGFIGAPWTLMAYMIEGGSSKTLSKAKAFLFKHPNESHKLLQKITDIAVEFLVGQARAGAQLLQVFESWGGELSPELFNIFALPYIRQISNRVKAELSSKANPHFEELPPMAIFARGSHYALESLTNIDYDVISLDWTINPVLAKERTKGKVTLQGNADPSVLYGTPDVIRKEVERMLNAFGTSKRYIANLGHGMYPDHDPDHLKVYLEAVKEISTQKNKSNSNVKTSVISSKKRGRDNGTVIKVLDGPQVFSSYVEELKMIAFEIINTEFPLKIAEMKEISNGMDGVEGWSDDSVRFLELSEDYESESFSQESKKRKVDSDGNLVLEIDLKDTAGKVVRNIYTQTVSVNKNVIEMLKIMKPKLGQMIQGVNKVKSWIQLNIPKMEDGHNLGVSIQEEILKELGTAEDHIFGVMESINKYHTSRAKIAAKILKYPGIADFKNSINELDEVQWLNLRLTCDDIAQSYAVLYDRIKKNWDRIEKPRPDQTHINT